MNLILRFISLAVMINGSWVVKSEIPLATSDNLFCEVFDLLIGKNDIDIQNIVINTINVFFPSRS